jgi:hypothetical protein
MLFQVTTSTKSLSTDFTTELGLSRVTDLVDIESSRIGKCFTTVRLWTNVLLRLTIVRNFNVILEEAFVAVILFTDWTLEPTTTALVHSLDVALEIPAGL